MIGTERDQTYILHILECIEKVQAYTGGDQERFHNDAMLQDAVLRVLQVMAESTQRLSEELKSAEKQIDWRGIAGFRNLLVHDYLGSIDLNLIWQVIDQELPALKSTLLARQKQSPQ